MTDDKSSDDDKTLFRRLMNDVTPLKNTKKRDAVPKMPAIKNIRKLTSYDKPTTEYTLSNYYKDAVSTDSTLSFSQSGVPHKRLCQLKRGDIPWEARLDLHGYRPDAARDALCAFIEHQHQRGKRSLLIIHGKGSHLGQAPILKNHVNHWLQQLPLVLAFHSALPRDGGTGALYVLLKRERLTSI